MFCEKVFCEKVFSSEKRLYGVKAKLKYNFLFYAVYNFITLPADTSWKSMNTWNKVFLRLVFNHEITRMYGMLSWAPVTKWWNKNKIKKQESKEEKKYVEDTNTCVDVAVCIRRYIPSSTVQVEKEKVSGSVSI